jgi:hypothetical protein
MRTAVRLSLITASVARLTVGALSRFATQADA